MSNDQYKWEYRNALRMMMIQSVLVLLLGIFVIIGLGLMINGRVSGAWILTILMVLQVIVVIRIIFRAGKRQAMEEQKDLFGETK